MVDVQSATAEIRRGIKNKEEEERRRKKPQARIKWPAVFHRAAMTNK